MRRIWVIVAALAWVVLSTEAHADTVYLTNGQSIWGSEAFEESDVIVIVRPSGNLRIPKSQVSRIERLRTTLPPFYSPPAESAPTGEMPTRGIGPGGGPGTPGPPGAPPPVGVSAPPPAGAAPQLPPPPPPPTPGR